MLNDEHSDPLPDWWARNRRLREERGLPPYEPPRFRDGVYTYEVVPDLEEEFNCSILFAGANPRYPDDWTVEVDGRALFEIGRHRDNSGNTVYELKSGAFERTLREAIADTEE